MKIGASEAAAAYSSEEHDTTLKDIDRFFGEVTTIAELCAIWERKQRIFRSEATHKTLSGEELTVIVSMPIPRTEEDFRSVPVSIVDITERKRLEEAIGQSEARFRAAFESAAHGISLVGLDNNYIEVNEAFCEIVGYSETELLATNFKTITQPGEPEPLVLTGRLADDDG